MGRVEFASETFNCSAPDTGNMEVLHRYGSAAQKAKWLRPLMAGDIRSAFLMTEPDVASSDATNIETSIRRDGDHYVINGRKWWSSGVGDPRCKLAIVMGKTDPTAARHAQQSQVLVPLDAPGVHVVRMLPVFGYDDAPHGHAEVILKDVRVPIENLVLGEGRGFEIAQGRLGPGRIHHCMRTLGAAEVALEKMVRRLQTRVAFGKRISDQSVWEQRVAKARIDIEMTRLLCLKAADMMDKVGNKGAKLEIAMIKVAAPQVALAVIDDAIQAHGGGGVSDDFGLAQSYAHIRTLRLADGPDEVHNRTIARLEYAKHTNAPEAVA
jgi:alkylation response protein AidB-like acyl-CoA dehydrogenase